MARRHVRVVIQSLAVEDLPTIGLNRGNQAPEVPVTNEKRTILDRRIVFRWPPDLGDSPLDLIRQRLEQPAICRKIEKRPRWAVAERGNEIERRHVVVTS